MAAPVNEATADCDADDVADAVDVNDAVDVQEGERGTGKTTIL